MWRKILFPILPQPDQGRRLASLALSLLLGFGLVGLVFAFGPTRAARAIQASAPSAPEAWAGAWQLGPDMPAAVWGGPAGEGFSRFSGHFYGPQGRIYFLGGRREDNSTAGTVFYLNLYSTTYAATGVTMPVPVSNYFISQIDDDGTGNGPGLYIVGGRMGTGVNTTAVQVYYPEMNTVATIATDPVPGAVRAVGGQAVVNGQLYAFGGFDAVLMYNQTYVYSPTASSGARWTDTGCNLPTNRSYIASVVVGSKIYAIGGDEFVGGTLVPITDTLVLDTGNLGACWQDAAIADLPTANGDAPAVYVPDGYLGGASGGIFVIGGFFPSPGPNRWVFRYDLATDTWEDFPAMAIPGPATGRRNQAAAYVSGLILDAPTGLGTGVPGIWTFGGFDGSGTNLMTNSSEFFSIEDNEVLVLPESLEVAGLAGATAFHPFTLVNLTGASDSFTLSYSADVTWSVGLPASAGPIANGGQTGFTMTVDIPADVSCPTIGTFTVTAQAQTTPAFSDSQPVTIRTVCGMSGIVYDANTSTPLVNAYVNAVSTVDPINVFYETWADSNGHYAIADVPAGDYWMYASANGYQMSIYPSGYPTGAVTVTIAPNSAVVDFNLVGSQMSLTSTAGFSATLFPGESLNQTFVVSNSGTGPLVYNLNFLDGAQSPPPPATLPEGLLRIDPQIERDLADSPEGVTDFLVVLNGQADLSAAYSIKDWTARGQYVLDTLRQYADKSQAEVRQTLNTEGVSYKSLYIINAIIVHAGDERLVNALAARSDVAQVVANHPIAVEKLATSDDLANPDTVGGNIAQINADDVWSTYGITGTGIVVANIDTGVQYDHPALQRQYRGYLGGSSYDHNYNWYDPYHQGPGGGATPADSNGHGTHTMGTIVGEDAALVNQVGVAPGAKWIACDGGDDASGFLLTNELLECAEWIVAPWDLTGANPDPAKRPHVVNNSWGGSDYDYWYGGAVAAWRAAGIFPAFSGGNSGPGCSTAHSPGDYWSTFAAGAVDNTNTIAGFSSRGPAPYTGIRKPDISAPGVNIRSTLPGNTYGNLSGTSMASPHVAGSVALLWAADPELIGQVDTTGWLLQQTATPHTTTEGCGGDTPTSHPNNTYGYGILNILAAVADARNGGVVPAWASVSPLGGEILPGNTGTITVTFSVPLTYTAGVYTATLWLVAYDPYLTDVRLPLTLTVEALPVYPLYLPIIRR